MGFSQSSVWVGSTYLQDAVLGGFDINSASNRIDLPRFSSKGDEALTSVAGTHASHPNYSAALEQIDTDVLDKSGINKLDIVKKREILVKYYQKKSEIIREILLQKCGKGGKKVDEVLTKSIRIKLQEVLETGVKKWMK